jgi:Ca2+-transporting ATPase
MWLALKDKVLILLSIAAVISLALGLFQDFGTPRQPGDAPVDWVEGVAIMVAVLIVVDFCVLRSFTIPTDALPIFRLLWVQ